MDVMHGRFWAALCVGALFGAIASVSTRCAADDAATDPQASRDPCELGYYYLERGETQKAIEQLDTAVKSPAKQATAYSYRALARIKNHDLKTALADAETAVDIAERNVKDKPPSAAAQEELAFAHIVKDEVLRWVWCGEAGVYAMRGSLSLTSGPSELELAIAACEKGLQIEPENAELLLQRAFVYARKGESTKVIADCSKVIQLEPHSNRAFVTRAFVTRAFARMDEDMCDEAIADCDKAIAISPMDAEAYLVRGRIYLSQKELRKAFADFEQAARIQPICASGTGLMTAFVCCCKRDHLKEAITGLDRVCAVVPTDPEFLLMRAYAHFLSGSPEKANTDLNEARKLNVHPTSLSWTQVIGDGIALARQANPQRTEVKK